MIGYAHDALNRLSVKTVPERAGLAAHHTRDVFYRHDLRGLMTEARFDGPGGSEHVAMAYDGAGRMTASTIGMHWATRTLTYGYDANGNRTRITHPDGTWFVYDHDGLDRGLSSVGPNHTLFGTIYDAAGRRASLGRYTGSITHYAHDGIGRLRLLDHRFMSEPANVAASFAYNPVSQIVLSTRTNDAYAFAGHGPGTTASAVNGLNQLTQAGGTAMAYDARGNLVSNGATSCAYDPENRLVEASGAHNASLIYDPLGRLYMITTPAEQTAGAAQRRSRTPHGVCSAFRRSRRALGR